MSSTAPLYVFEGEGFVEARVFGGDEGFSFEGEHGEEDVEAADADEAEGGEKDRGGGEGEVDLVVEIFVGGVEVVEVVGTVDECSKALVEVGLADEFGDFAGPSIGHDEPVDVEGAGEEGPDGPEGDDGIFAFDVA